MPVFLNFMVGGAVIAVLGAVGLWAMVKAGVWPLVAYAIQLTVTLALNFAYNYLVTWRHRPRIGLRRQVAWFLATRGATQAGSWLVFLGLTAVGLQYELANAVCLGIAMVINFVTSDKLVFRDGEKARPRQPATQRPRSPALTSLAGAPMRVCVLVPTRNEAGNVVALLARLSPVLARLGGEVLFVDDSDDDTPAVVAAAARTVAVPIRLLHRASGARIGGLGGAVQAGLAAVTALWTVVMDGDLQHPPEQVAHLIAVAERGADLVVASRYCGNGSPQGLSSRFRGMASTSTTGAARMLFPRTLAHVSDPMSGFFAVRTAAVNPAALRPRGFKILLELLVRTPRLVVAEVPFTFAERHDGQSKASWQEGARYLRQLAVLRLATAGRAGRLPRVDGQLPSQPGTGHPGQAPIAVIPAQAPIAVIPAQAPSAAIPAQAPSAAIPTSRRVA